MQIDELVSLVKKYNLFVIEDAAESLGSVYKGKHTGTFGDIGILSFNGNKIITTGAGGAIITNKKNLAEQARHLIANARTRDYQHIHDRVGYNYRMPNINAAIGLTQIKKIKKFIKYKRKIFSLYEKAFARSKYFRLVKEPKYCKSNYWLQTLLIKDKYSSSLNLIIKKLNKNKIQVRPGWKLLPNLNYFKKNPSMDLSIAKNITKRIINIPSSSFLIKFFKQNEKK